MLRAGLVRGPAPQWPRGARRARPHRVVCRAEPSLSFTTKFANQSLLDQAARRYQLGMSSRGFGECSRAVSVVVVAPVAVVAVLEAGHGSWRAKYTYNVLHAAPLLERGGCDTWFGGRLLGRPAPRQPAKP